MQIQFTGRIVADDLLLATDIRDLEIAKLSGETYLYAATGGGGGITAYRLGEGGGLASLTDAHYFSSTEAGSVSGMLTRVRMADTARLFYANSSTEGLLGLTLGESGTLDQPGFGIVLPDMPEDIGDVVSLQASAGYLFYFADNNSGRLVGYVLPAQGDARRVQTGWQEDTPTFSSSAILRSTALEDAQFLLVADEGAQGLTSYRINTATGQLTETDRLGASDGLGINTPSAMEVVSAFGQTFVVLGAYNSSSLSVIRLTPTGQLEPYEHVLDTLGTRFAGLQSLSVTQVNGYVLVVAGGADDGLSLFTLLPDGRLVHMQTLAHWAGAGLENVADITAVQNGDTIQVFVSSGSAAGLSQFSIPLATLGDVIRGTPGQAQVLTGTARDDLIVSEGTGNDTLSGGAGNDTLVAGDGDTVLEGGQGRDTFVLSGGIQTQTVRDFQIGIDRLDLSAFAFLRNPGQLTLSPTQTGARITFRDTTVIVTTADNLPLGIEDILPGAFSWPDRALILANDIGQDIFGDPEDGATGGSEGDDTTPGGTGDDTTPGGTGDDTTPGGTGNDTTPGDTGDDTTPGDTGNDIGQEIFADPEGGFIAGSQKNDTVIGAPGNDNLWSQGGDDTISGGEGNDTLGGGEGQDAIWGGEGEDIVFGGNGHDTIWGDDQADQLWGGLGDDLIRGGNGSDSLGGSLGHDTVWGGSGDDLIFGDIGQDEIHGDNGNDTLWAGSETDIAYGGRGDDILGGGLGHDTIYGEEDRDLIFGGDGHDSLTGGANSDTLYAGAGNDTLSGGGGDDVLSGGGGDDVLSGGSGNDVFGFAPNQGDDRLTDFEPGRDMLHLYGISGGVSGLSIRDDVDGNAVLFLGGGQLTFTDISSNTLNMDDFMFL